MTALARPARRILLLGGDADANLGDRAILSALCSRLQHLIPGVELVVVSSDPERARRYYGARAVRPGATAVAELLREARRADLTLVGGGGLFQDDDSRLKMPYWGLRVAALRAAGARLVGFSVGAGPLEHPESHVFARLALACLESCSVRDEEARRTLAGLSTRAPELVPDPAFMLEATDPARALEVLASAGVPCDGRPLLGVAARRWFHVRSGFVPHRVAWRLGRRRLPGAGAREILYDRLAAALDAAACELGAHVLFLPTYTVPHEADDAACEAVASRMKAADRSMLVLEDPCLYRAVAGRLAVMLGIRMHPLILAAGMGTPVVGLAYNQKFFGVFDLLGETDVLPVQAVVERDVSADLARRLVAAAGRDRSALRERSRQLASRTESALRAVIS